MRASEIETWMRTAGHLWFEIGWDPVNGGFYEHLHSDGAPNVGEDRRVRVQFRQIFSIAFCHHHGYIENFNERLNEAIAFVWDQLWAAGGEAGFPHIVTSEGQVVDPRRDTYDHAFALLAFAWAYRATGSAQAREKLTVISEFVDQNLRHAHSGFKETMHGQKLRRQNPHMHCFEAYMALFEITKEDVYRDRADNILDLFIRHFWDADAGVLREYFSDNWGQPQSSEYRRIVEPGHMAEWVWLLRKYQLLTGTAVDRQCETIFSRCRVLGLDEKTGFLWDGVTPDGTVSNKTRRLWPQTELLKASIAQLTFGNGDVLEFCADRLNGIHEQYLTGRVAGGWYDQFDAEGQSTKPLMPASTHYHVVLALHEARQSEPLMAYMERHYSCT